MFILHLMIELLGSTNDLSTVLQLRDQNIVQVISLIDTTKRILQDLTTTSSATEASRKLQRRRVVLSIIVITKKLIVVSNHDDVVTEFDVNQFLRQVEEFCMTNFINVINIDDTVQVWCANEARRTRY